MLEKHAVLTFCGKMEMAWISSFITSFMFNLPEIMSLKSWTPILIPSLISFNFLEKLAANLIIFFMSFP